MRRGARSLTSSVEAHVAAGVVHVDILHGSLDETTRVPASIAMRRSSDAPPRRSRRDAGSIIQ
jgi:hypothetical protein